MIYGNRRALYSRECPSKSLVSLSRLPIRQQKPCPAEHSSPGAIDSKPQPQPSFCPNNYSPRHSKLQTASDPLQGDFSTTPDRGSHCARSAARRYPVPAESGAGFCRGRQRGKRPRAAVSGTHDIAYARGGVLFDHSFSISMRTLLTVEPTRVRSKLSAPPFFFTRTSSPSSTSTL